MMNHVDVMIFPVARLLDGTQTGSVPAYSQRTTHGHHIDETQPTANASTLKFSDFLILFVALASSKDSGQRAPDREGRS
jgi:hypothetical protein